MRRFMFGSMLREEVKEGGDGGGGDPPKEDKKPPEEELISMPKSAFDARLEQAKRASLKEAGIDPEVYKKQTEELAKLKAAEEERKKKEMSVQERLEAERAEAKTAAEKAIRERDAANRRAKVVEAAAKFGVRDVGYALFRTADLEDDADLEAFFKTALEDDGEKARFGVSIEPPEKKSSTSAKGSGDKDPPPKEKGKSDEKPVLGMSKKEYREYRMKKHGF